MILTKHFKLKEYEKLNEFMKTHRPRGEKGLLCNTEGYSIFYEVGEPMDKYDQIAALKFQLGQHRERIMHTKKEILITQAQTDIHSKDIAKNEYEARKYKEEQDTIINAKKKLIELEEAGANAVLQMMEEIENEIPN